MRHSVLGKGVGARGVTWGVVAGVCLTAAGAFADIRFIGGAGADLTDPANWEGGACPGASDVAEISVGDVAKTLTLSKAWAVRGIRLTDTVETLTIESTGAALTVGVDGIALVPGYKSATKGLALKVPVVIAAEQTWDLGEQLLETHGTISGTDTLTIGNAYGVEHYAAPGYGGTIVYSMQMIDWVSVPVRLHAKGRWAKKVTTPTRDFVKMCGIGLAAPAGERWNLSDVFTAESAYVSVNDDVTFQLVADAGTVVCAAEDEPVVPKAGYRMETSAGTFEVAGGTFNAWNYFRLLNGSAVRVSGGVFNGKDDGKICVGGGDGVDVQDATDRRFDQTDGEVNAYGLAVGGDRSDWSGVIPFGDYTLGGGTLNARQSWGWNSLGGGLMLSAKITDPTDVSAPGVFTQTGGIANLDFVRFGCDNGEGTNYANMNGFGMVRLMGGTLNLGGDGFRAGTSWNRDTTDAMREANAAYRVTMTGGTFAPDAATLGAQADFPPSADAVTVAPKRDMVWNGPVWGEGTIRKAGGAKLTLSDAGKFSGALDIAEGEVVVMPPASDPEADTCVRWTGDSARAYVNGAGQAVAVGDGEEVVEWHEANNAGRRKAVTVTYDVTAEQYKPTGPTLVENAFGPHAGLRFYGNALEIPAADNPVAGQGEWSVVIVFKSDRQYWGATWDAAPYMWRFLPGVIGNATVDWQNNDWGVSLGSGSVYHLGVGYREENPPEGYDGYQPVAAEGVALNDGKPHVLICTQRGTVTTINADGALTSTNRTGQAAAAYPRQNLPCYIGFNSSETRDKTAAPDWEGNMRTAQENFTDAAFLGRSPRSGSTAGRCRWTSRTAWSRRWRRGTRAGTPPSRPRPPSRRFRHWRSTRTR